MRRASRRPPACTEAYLPFRVLQSSCAPFRSCRSRSWKRRSETQCKECRSPPRRHHVAPAGLWQLGVPVKSAFDATQRVLHTGHLANIIRAVWSALGTYEHTVPDIFHWVWPLLRQISSRGVALCLSQCPLPRSTLSFPNSYTTRGQECTHAMHSTPIACCRREHGTEASASALPSRTLRCCCSRSSLHCHSHVATGGRMHPGEVKCNAIHSLRLLNWISLSVLLFCGSFRTGQHLSWLADC
jgi:hypothetical protein